MKKETHSIATVVGTDFLYGENSKKVRLELDKLRLEKTFVTIVEK